ncbi:hypothetical protein RvY_07069 [Ramazzottius varieornatus]|uniref:Uncharacterized protein n=1 Tax=Ramazzottius varieornatus TaxID=947166 RepID=A0A1D1V420_RAMVA|nr:hypothetical protein RvY_07069 [Ramazzottius varieornatus]
MVGHTFQNSDSEGGSLAMASRNTPRFSDLRGSSHATILSVLLFHLARRISNTVPRCALLFRSRRRSAHCAQEAVHHPTDDLEPVSSLRLCLISRADCVLIFIQT